MLTNIYQLVAPKTIALNLNDISTKNRVIVRPTMMAICAADQRYYQGRRSQEIMKAKLPLALIHESVGEVVHSPFPELPVGSKVAMIPNHNTQSSTKPLSKELYENYDANSIFLSSGADGFMQELVSLPKDRVVAYYDIADKYAVLSELLSVASHAVSRLNALAHSRRETFGVWGDGPVSYLTGMVIRALYPDAHITIIGMQVEKLSYFTFANDTHLASKIPDNFHIDHGFECTGGNGISAAINQIIKYANPQATAVLMGVSEENVPIFTRDVLEKGMLLVGSSRSGRTDFQQAIKLLENKLFRERLNPIINVANPVRNVEDINDAFMRDLATPFKTVFKWEI